MQMSLPIYLDYMATTPVDPQVAEKMSAYLTPSGVFGNPASQTHLYGWQALEAVEKARQQVAQLLHADPREIVWTSGATESDNLAIIGAAKFYQRQGKHIITLSTEHKAVLDPCHYLVSQGFEVTFLNPDHNGLVDLKKLEAAIRRDTILISIMAVNNETGVIQDLQAINTMAKSHGILFHTDATQAIGKIPLDMQKCTIDLLSFSAHKIYGPKGIGGLFVRRTPKIHLEPLIYGGGHEKGLRSGTLATHQIAGLGEAFAIAQKRFEEDREHITALQKQLWSGLSTLAGVHLNGDSDKKIPGCLNLSFEGVNGESLMARLRKLAISSGSACNSANPDPSHVLLGMGLSREMAANSIRISYGRFTTEKEMAETIAQITEQVNYLRSISPVWDSVKEKIVPSCKTQKS